MKQKTVFLKLFFLLSVVLYAVGPKKIEAQENGRAQSASYERYRIIEKRNIFLPVSFKKLKEEIVPGGPGARPSSRPRSKLLAPALAVLVVAVGLLVGIRIQIGRQSPAQAAENKVAIMYFESLCSDTTCM